MRGGSGMTRVGFFQGPWDTGTIARDGGVHGFRNIELTIRRMCRRGLIHSATPLENLMFAKPPRRRQLADLDVIYANAGPVTTLLMLYRELMGLDFRIVREVRTLGWIGYAFQEFVASSLARPDDLRVHTSAYSAGIWNRALPDRDLFYYPLFREAPTPEPHREIPAKRTAFFGSRVAEDKGFHYLPAILEKLNENSWNIANLTVCGDLDGNLINAETFSRMKRRGVSVDNHGPQSRGQAIRLMSASHLVLFPSVSSFESAGRVVAEAWALGKPVIASDFCSGHDLVRETHRIPLQSGSFRQGTTEQPFAVADLDLDRWIAPDPDVPAFMDDHCRRYEADPDQLQGMLEGRIGGKVTFGESNMAMRWEWPELDRDRAMEWCGRVNDLVERGFRDRADLTNPGGLFKRALIESGFAPTVGFTT